MLSNVKRFHRLANMISNEKLVVDRALRLSLTAQGDYKYILKFYGDILKGMELNNINASVGALCELTIALKNYITTTKKYHPEYFC